MISFVRQPLEDGAVQFIIQTDADRWQEPESKAPTWIGLAAGLAVGFATPAFSLVLGLATWWLVRRVLKKLMGSKTPKVRGTIFVLSPAEIRSHDGTVIPVNEIKEVVWRDWAIGRSDAGFGVYVERKKGTAFTVTKDMDGATAHRLANEMADVLGVPATEGLARQFTSGVPSVSAGSGGGFVTPAVSEGGGFATFAASEAKATPAVSQGSPHRPDGPRPGDVLMKETGPRTFALLRVTHAGFEPWKDVPHSGLIDAMMFAHATVGDRNLWLEKLVDAGQPTLVPKLSQSSEST